MEIRNFNYFNVENSGKPVPTNSKQDDIFDMDLNVTINDQPLVDQWTSKSLCTPGCGHTGTGNSYCCTCGKK